eukprot:gb/GECH01014575.1/.p1 GENE.gb/GECH01014575.1/~~gb/GECH01014575.1/.p1  ORF type:complete len:214 (+),score=77.60 gb/GECH01014575.1/:1-642(+)
MSNYSSQPQQVIGEGFQGPLVTKLQRALDKALEKIQHDCSWSKFKSCFSSHVREDPKSRHVLKQVHRQLLASFLKTMKSEFEIICSEWKLREKLNALYLHVVLDGEQTVFANAPEQPSNQFSALATTYKQQQIQQLETILQRLKNDNVQLESRLALKRQETETARETLSEGNKAMDAVIDRMQEKWSSHAIDAAMRRVRDRLEASFALHSSSK